MFLTSKLFHAIGSALRAKVPGVHPTALRQIAIQVDVSVSTASGRAIDAKLCHLSRAGLSFLVAAPSSVGEQLALNISGQSEQYAIVCEVCDCRKQVENYLIRTSFVCVERSPSTLVGLTA